MGASRSKSAGVLGKGAQLGRVLLRPQHRGLLASAVVVLISICGAVYAWQRWGEPATHSPEYLVTAERISVTPQPTWIHTNVKAEVMRSLMGARLELLDRQLVENVADA